MHTEEQVAAWKKVTDAVHAKGGYIYMQAWALGRANAGQDPKIETVAPSPIGLKDHPVPREMTIEDIDNFVKAYGTAAENAKKAGFDGIELHGANGYLVNQFLESVSNKRTDAYGGDWQGRSKFLFRVLDALINVFGQERIGVRLSPWGRFQDQLEDDPYATYLPVVQEIVKRYPKFGVSAVCFAGE
jgi:NADPH2 dehydrogenase